MYNVTNIDNTVPGVLNELGVGLAPGETCLVAARPGMGKTPFLLQIARDLLNAGRSVMLFSAEKSAGEIAKRFEAAGEAEFVIVDCPRLFDGAPGNGALEEIAEYFAGKGTRAFVGAYLEPDPTGRPPALYEVRERVGTTEAPDAIIFVHRYPYFDGAPSDGKSAPYGALIVAKNMHGNVGRREVVTSVTEDGLVFAPAS